VTPETLDLVRGVMAAIAEARDAQRAYDEARARRDAASDAQIMAEQTLMLHLHNATLTEGSDGE